VGARTLPRCTLPQRRPSRESAWRVRRSRQWLALTVVGGRQARLPPWLVWGGRPALRDPHPGFRRSPQPILTVSKHWGARPAQAHTFGTHGRALRPILTVSQRRSARPTLAHTFGPHKRPPWPRSTVGDLWAHALRSPTRSDLTGAHPGRTQPLRSRGRAPRDAPHVRTARAPALAVCHRSPRVGTLPTPSAREPRQVVPHEVLALVEQEVADEEAVGRAEGLARGLDLGGEGVAGGVGGLLGADLGLHVFMGGFELVVGRAGQAEVGASVDEREEAVEGVDLVSVGLVERRAHAAAAPGALKLVHERRAALAIAAGLEERLAFAVGQVVRDIPSRPRGVLGADPPALRGHGVHISPGQGLQPRLEPGEQGRGCAGVQRQGQHELSGLEQLPGVLGVVRHAVGSLGEGSAGA